MEGIGEGVVDVGEKERDERDGARIERDHRPSPEEEIFWSYFWPVHVQRVALLHLIATCGYDTLIRGRELECHTLTVEEFHDISILNYVFFPFSPQRTLFPRLTPCLPFGALAK